MTYFQKLRLPLWQKKRLQIFNRDNFKCCACGSADKNLQVHHTEYFDNIEPWDYPDDLLITLCEDCHKKENVRFQYEKYLLRSLRMAGYTAFELLHLSTLIDTMPDINYNLKKLINRRTHG